MASMDDATRLTPQGEGRYSGQTSADYWNTMGPFGGWGAAMALRAIIEDPRAEGDPVALTVQYMGRITEGSVNLAAGPTRVGRTTSFWQSVIAQGEDEPPAILGTATLAKRRETISHQEAQMPDVSPASDCAITEIHPRFPAFFHNYTARVIEGSPMPKLAPAHSLVWVEDKGGAPWSALGLMGLGDLSFPTIWSYTGGFQMIATVSLTAHFYAAMDEIQALGPDALLLQSFGRHAHRGFYDQTALIWSPGGQLLATTDQMVWVRPVRNDQGNKG